MASAKAAEKTAAEKGALVESRREKNKREKLERILQVSRTLFRVNGFEKTTTQQIADAAEIGSGTLFLYAKSKGDLLLLVFKGELEDVMKEAWRQLPANASFDQRLEQLVDVNIQYHRRDLPTARALMRELVFPDNPDRRQDILLLQANIVDRFATLVSDAQTSGELRDDVEPVIVAKCLFSIYHEQLQNWLSAYLQYEEFREDLQQRFNLIIDGVRC